jgi:hypothetical protein
VELKKKESRLRSQNPSDRLVKDSQGFYTGSRIGAAPGRGPQTFAIASMFVPRRGPRRAAYAK